MYYYCPNCASMKMPKPINYFLPKKVKCVNCGYINTETKFIKEHREKLAFLHYTH